ncbi:MAG: PKD domain-containing protein [Bacteroidota bacterium]
MILDFNNEVPEMSTIFWDIYFLQTNASISDDDGNLLFFTDGVNIYNAQFEVMENGEGLNPGLHSTQQNNSDKGYILDQGAMILPVPESDSLYYLFHKDKIIPGEEGVLFSSQHLYYSLIDMSLNDGLGSVIAKNQVILEGTFDKGKLTATKHANGRDWWLLVKKHSLSKRIPILITPDKIQVLEEQTVGQAISSFSIGQGVFAPDGSKYVDVNVITITTPVEVSIFDFDRCDGSLSNPIHLSYLDSAACAGVAISPNSRFLYVSSFKYVYQYDLWADNINATKDTVAVWDGFLQSGFFATTFYLAQLAPDGKIYINSNNGVSYLHVIEYPDLPGDSCQVCQHCLPLITSNGFSLPNFPNYRLNYLEDSPCDTLRKPPTALFTYEEDGLTVYFEDASEHDIREWAWNFGEENGQWIVNNSQGSTSYTYEEEGIYEVCLAVSNPRGRDTTCQELVIQTTSVEEALMEESFRLSPNPTSGKVRVQWNGCATCHENTTAPSSYIVLDASGRVVLRPNVERDGQLDLSALPAGVYIVQARQEGQIQGTAKVVLTE